MANTKDRKNYGSEFKAKVAMEAVCGRLTINEIAKRFEVHPVQVSKWKKQFLDAVPGIGYKTPAEVYGQRAVGKAGKR